MTSTVKPQTLQGKTAIVTGASRGLGAGFAYDLAERGANIVATYTSPTSTAKIEELVSKISALPNGTRCLPIRADLRSPSSATSIVTQAVDTFGPHIDILVNNAGAEVVKPVTDITTDDFDHVYHLNVRAPLLLVQAVTPYLRTGRIINISSVGSRAGMKSLSLYCSSKAALEGMTRCWAAELGAQGHTVNAVCPGPVQSEMLDNIPREIIEMQLAQTPIQNRLGTVDDVAQIVAWLASEESRWVTGQCISASGGWAVY